MTSPEDKYAAVTDMPGELASREQIARLYRRYHWAQQYAKGRDVLEVGCGAGQGLGYLARAARSVTGGDISPELLTKARSHYGSRLAIRELDAENLALPDDSFDVVILFEALYYLRKPRRFFTEAHRVLRAGSVLLLATANKDLFDFTPSRHSIAYYGVVELKTMLDATGFRSRFFGDTSVLDVPRWQRSLRRIKQGATRLGIMPQSKVAKSVLKRVVFGELTTLPAEVQPGMARFDEPVLLRPDIPNDEFKVLFCEASRID